MITTLLDGIVKSLGYVSRHAHERLDTAHNLLLQKHFFLQNECVAIKRANEALLSENKALKKMI